MKLEERPSYFMAPGFIPGYKLPGKIFEHKLILETVASYFGIEARFFWHKTRKKEVVEMRHIAIYFIRNYTKMTVTQIGVIFQRDHTSILHAIHQVSNLMQSDPEYKKHIEYLAILLN